ncbi:MAG: hypothetical protein ACRDF6_03715, partial [bacterium]
MRDPDGVDRLIHAWAVDPDEPDQREAVLVGAAQGAVLGMLGVVAAVLVALQPVGTLGVGVGRSLPGRVNTVRIERAAFIMAGSRIRAAG